MTMQGERLDHHLPTVDELLLRPAYADINTLLDALQSTGQADPAAVADGLCLVGGIASLTTPKEDTGITLALGLPELKLQETYQRLLTLTGAAGQSPHTATEHAVFGEILQRVVAYEGGQIYLTQLHRMLTRVALYKSLSQRGAELDPDEQEQIDFVDSRTQALARLAASHTADQSPQKDLAAIFRGLDPQT